MTRNPELSIVPAKGLMNGEADEEEVEVEEVEEEEGSDENDDVEISESREDDDDEDGNDDDDNDDLGIQIQGDKKKMISPPATKKSLTQSTQKTLGQLEAESMASREGREIDNEVAVDATDGSHWVMQRLRGLGSDPRGRKRLHVLRVSERLRLSLLKCFFCF